MVALGNDRTDVLISLIRTAGPDIEIRREKSWLVADIITAGHVEECIKPTDKGLRAAHRLYERSHILRNEERVCPGVALVEGVATPRAHIHGSEWSEPASVTMARMNEAGEFVVREVGVPEILPVRRTGSIFVVTSCVAQPLGQQGDLIVVGGVLHVDRAGAVRAFNGDIAKIVPIIETAAPFLVVVGRRDFSVVNLGDERGVPVDAFQTFNECIGEKKLGVAAALRSAVVVAAARIG